MPRSTSQRRRGAGSRRRHGSGRAGSRRRHGRRRGGLTDRDSPAARALENSLRRAADARTTLQESAEAFAYDTDGSDVESDQPYIDSLVAEQGRSIYTIMTPFKQREFERLWHIVGPAITSPWVRGKGPKCKTIPKDAFFMAMNVMHLPTKWDKHGLDFHLKGPTCEKQIWKMIQIAAPILKREFQVNPTMEELREQGLQFNNYPYAHHATDVHFIHGNRPNLPHEEAMAWFSFKHWLYGMKVEASVLPGTGAACNWTTAIAAGEHDKTIMEMNLSYHKKTTKKTAGEMAAPDHGEQSNAHPNRWAILLDKAYIGIEEDVRAIIPTKKLPGRPLTSDAFKRNVDIAEDRVLPENFFGRGAKMFGALAKKYTWSRDRLSVVVDFCFSLVNYHILYHPLREKDGEYYKKVLADLKRRAKEAKQNGAARQRRYREKKARQELALASLDDDVDGDESDDDDDLGGGRSPGGSASGRSRRGGGSPDGSARRRGGGQGSGRHSRREDRASDDDFDEDGRIVDRRGGRRDEEDSDEDEDVGGGNRFLDRRGGRREEEEEESEEDEGAGGADGRAGRRAGRIIEDDSDSDLDFDGAGRFVDELFHRRGSQQEGGDGDDDDDGGGGGGGDDDDDGVDDDDDDIDMGDEEEAGSASAPSQAISRAVAGRRESVLRRRVVAGSVAEEEERKDDGGIEEDHGKEDDEASRAASWGRLSQMGQDFRPRGSDDSSDEENEFDGSLGRGVDLEEARENRGSENETAALEPARRKRGGVLIGLDGNQGSEDKMASPKPLKRQRKRNTFVYTDQYAT